MRRVFGSPEERITAVVAYWANHLALPPGNLWEPALVRYMLVEHQRLGADTHAILSVMTFVAYRLQLPLPEVFTSV